MKKILSTLIMMASLLLSSCNEYDITVKTSVNGNGTGVYIPSIDPNNCNSAYTYRNLGNPPDLSEISSYYRHDDVAMYIIKYKKLPQNYVTKSENENNPGKYNNKNYNIGGDNFSNYQKLLPPEKTYIECDVNTQGTSGSVRGTKRIVYSRYNFRVFYTMDHYDSFTEYLGYNNWGPSFYLNGTTTTYRTPCYVG